MATIEVTSFSATLAWVLIGLPVSSMPPSGAATAVMNLLERRSPASARSRGVQLQPAE